MAKTESLFAELGLVLRIEISIALAETAICWIEEEGLLADDQLRSVTPAASVWHITSARGPHEPFRLRAQIDAASAPSAFVAAAFRAILGRAADPSGAAFYTEKLKSDADCGLLVLQSLAASKEAAERQEAFEFFRSVGGTPPVTNASA